MDTRSKNTQRLRALLALNAWTDSEVTEFVTYKRWGLIQLAAFDTDASDEEALKTLLTIEKRLATALERLGCL